MRSTMKKRPDESTYAMSPVRIQRPVEGSSTKISDVARGLRQ